MNIFELKRIVLEHNQKNPREFFRHKHFGFEEEIVDGSIKGVESLELLLDNDSFVILHKERIDPKNLWNDVEGEFANSKQDEEDDLIHYADDFPYALEVEDHLPTAFWARYKKCIRDYSKS